MNVDQDRCCQYLFSSFLLIVNIWILCLCFQALELDESNEKALFRRGEALFSMNEFDRAKNGFQQVVELYPANRAARSQVGRPDIINL